MHSLPAIIAINDSLSSSPKCEDIITRTLTDLIELLNPHIRLGRAADFPALLRFSRHRPFIASPPNIAASLDPLVEQPREFAASGEFHRSLSMFTHRDSISAVCGYSSLSIKFLPRHSSMSF